MAMTIGVMTRQIASLTRKAERTPVVTTMAASSRTGWRARATAQPVTSPKNPESRRLATTIIMPSNKAIVSRSMAR